MKRSKPTKKIPALTSAELRRNLKKTDAVLLRLTPADKETINEAASKLGITTTELLTKAGLMIAAKIKG